MLRWPEIAGVAEVMNMRGVLDRSEPMQGVVAAGLASGKLICGHARGLEGVSLQGLPPRAFSRTTRSPRATTCWPSCAPASPIELRGSHDYVLPGRGAGAGHPCRICRRP